MRNADRRVERACPGEGQGHRSCSSTHGHQLQLRPAQQRGTAIDIARDTSNCRRAVAVGRFRRRVERDTRYGKKTCIGAGQPGSERLCAFPAGDSHGGDFVRNLDNDKSGCGQWRLHATAKGALMSSSLSVGDVRTALAERLFPSVTVFNRLEGQPRTIAFDRALRAEVRDALWMLTKQWQMGEFRGSDAGSPVFAKLQVDTTRLTKYRPGAGKAEAFDEHVPLEAKVERRHVPLRIGGRVASLDLRLAMGR